MTPQRFDVDGLPTVWYRRLTDTEWARIRRKRRYGPARTLREFWDIVREDLRRIWRRERRSTSPPWC
jgi:hypothetical protein